MRIAFTGTASTGKTTLINEVLKYDEFKMLNLEFVPTDARLILDSMGFKSMDKMSVEQTSIFQKKYFYKKIDLEHNRKSFITDRSFIDIASYWLIRDCNNDFSKASQLIEVARNKSFNYDIHFYFPYGIIPFEDDGYRSRNEHQREQIGKQIIKFCIDWKINYITLDTPDLQKRVKVVLNTINSLR